MKKNIIKRITSIGLCVALIFGITINVRAVENEVHKNPFLQGYKGITDENQLVNNISKVSREVDVSVNNEVKTMPTSLGINMKNIDTSSLHDTNPLDDSAISVLLEKGYTSDDIKSMDRGDFLEIRYSWTLTPDEIKGAKKIYSALEDVDLSNWTYGEFIDYCKVKDTEKYKPTAKQIQDFNNRGITLADAREMLKDFSSYDAILDLSDDEVKEYLNSYYQVKNDYLEALNIVKLNTQLLKSNPMDYPEKVVDGVTFYQIDFPGYGTDWFHEDSGSQNYAAPLEYAVGAQEVWEVIYDTTDDYSAANLYGTLSNYHQAGHEGIDYNGNPEGKPLKAVVDGHTTKTSSSMGLVALDSSDGINRIFYMHMINIPADGDVSKGDTIGDEGGRFNSQDNYFAVHLHLQVYEDQSQSYCHSSKDAPLSSAIPYFIAR